MKKVTEVFTPQVDVVIGLCPVGEAWTEEKILQMCSILHTNHANKEAVMKKVTDIFYVERVPDAERIGTAKKFSQAQYTPALTSTTALNPAIARPARRAG